MELLSQSYEWVRYYKCLGRTREDAKMKCGACGFEGYDVAVGGDKGKHCFVCPKCGEKIPWENLKNWPTGGNDAKRENSGKQEA